MVGFVLLRTVTPHSGNFIRDCCPRRGVSCSHFITSDVCVSRHVSAERESFVHAPEHAQATDFHDIAEDQCKLSLALDLRGQKTKFPEEENCEEYCSVSEIFCKIVARVNWIANTGI